MKGLILGCALLASAVAFADIETAIEVAGGDPVSQFVNDTMVRGQAILAQKSASARLAGICSLLKARVGNAQIGATWLGEFRNLPREKNAVQQWYRLVPSIIVSKAIQGVGNGGGGSVAVDPRSVNKGGGRYEVGITVTTDKGRSYSGRAVVMAVAGKYKIVDGIYAGFSAVNYLGRDYQDFLNQEYNKDPGRSMPVTALIHNVKAEDGFTQCP